MVILKLLVSGKDAKYIYMKRCRWDSFSGTSCVQKFMINSLIFQNGTAGSKVPIPRVGNNKVMIQPKPTTLIPKSSIPPTGIHGI